MTINLRKFTDAFDFLVHEAVLNTERMLGAGEGDPDKARAKKDAATNWIMAQVRLIEPFIPFPDAIEDKILTAAVGYALDALVHFFNAHGWPMHAQDPTRESEQDGAATGSVGVPG